MELPIRHAQDRFVPSGAFTRLVNRLRETGVNSATPTLIVHSFDPRTRMLPFILWDKQIVPAGIRAVSAAMASVGFSNQRMVSQSWNPNLRPSRCRLGGRPPELLLVSAMQIHSAAAYAHIRDAHSLGADRPLIIAGGPKAIYQGWDFFGFDEAGHSADIVCTGEEFVLLELIERLLECKRPSETLRQAFERGRRRGWLDDIPGLLYDRAEADDARHELVDTGVQRLVRDFDELPPPVDGYRYLERPHRRADIDAAPLPLSHVRRYSKVASILTTRGCKFRCGYCPIPAYNQFSFRTKSPDGLVRDIAGLRRHAGINLYFGTDDNFFNSEDTVVATFEALARAEFEKDDIGKPIRFGTEATEFDVYKQKAHLPLCYRGGLRAVWFGIEDMTATLVNKGQSVSKTAELFAEMRQHRILPMAMMMHFDGQPLTSPKGTMNGLLNQVRYLQKVGAASVQVTVLGPAAGTKDYDAVLKSGIILETLGGKQVEDCYWDGNHVISIGSSSQPWKLQRNMLLAYAAFYNPWNLLRSFVKKQRKWSDTFLQIWGMWGLAKTAGRLVPWMLRIAKQVDRKRYTVLRDVPHSRYPIVPPTAWAPAAQANGVPREAAIKYIRQTIGAVGESAKAKPARRPSLTKY